ncbi:MAG: nucleotidyltransferase domain-containing protein [Bacillota bacterium]|nr:nucleotidyltransferase domain-containing protein [Bacillota bacterium]
MTKHLPTQISSILHNLIPKLRANLLIYRIYLFGSFSKGTYSKDSDIDIAIFLSECNNNLKSVYKNAVKICSEYGKDIQVQVFNQDELLEPAGIVEEIIEFGTDITEI